MRMMRAIWVFVAAGVLIGCGGDGRAPATETVVQTEGNKDEAVTAARTAARLDEALQNRDVDEVQSLVISIGVLAGHVAIAREIGSGGSRTPFPEPVPPPQQATTACDDTGCTYDRYLQETLYADLVDGSVRAQGAAGTRSIDIALRVTGGWGDALHTTMYVTGALQLTPTTVNGTITLVRTYPDRREQPESIRYQAVTFDPDPSTTTPLSGSVAAEWTTADYDTGVYTTLAATVPFP